jgi:hypothetical protein
MKPVVFLLCLLSVARAEPDSASGRATEVRRLIADELRREFTFESLPNPTESATDADVVVLPSVNVFETKEGPDKTMKDARQRAEAEHFSWTSGGTILSAGRMKLTFKYAPERGFIELLNVAW